MHLQFLMGIQLARDFYFLSKGGVVVTKQGNYISKLNQGTFFREMAALCSGARTTTCLVTMI